MFKFIKLILVVVMFCLFSKTFSQDIKIPEIDWVLIPSATFIMGSPENEDKRNPDEIQHKVYLSSYYISKFEITVEQYNAFCIAKQREMPFDMTDKNKKNAINYLSWQEADAFAEWIGARLPTEAEWEYACRAETTTPFNTGNCLKDFEANYNANYPQAQCIEGQFVNKIMPVGSYPANNFDIHDMHGNVWEWCSDWYGPYSAEDQENPQGPSMGEKRVYRGGAYIRSAKYCRSANRIDYYPDYRYSYVGFRVAKDY